MTKFAFALAIFLAFPAVLVAQNCCAPTVPQQGVLGEISALPHSLEIGVHYEFLRSAKMYNGTDLAEDPSNTRSEWQRVTMTTAYGVIKSLSVSAIIPYTWKTKIKDIASWGRVENSANGMGDITIFARYSPIMRSFVNYRELSIGLGIKAPTGSTNEENFGIRLLQELQPGTGSWDFDGTFSYYQGYEQVDFVVGATYFLTTKHEGYKFGNQFSYMLASNFHIRAYLDLSLSFMGAWRGKDRVDQSGGGISEINGRNQIWFTPGVKVQILPNRLGIQAYYEHPVYQHFIGTQLGSDFNIRFSAIYTIQLKKAENADL